MNAGPHSHLDRPAPLTGHGSSESACSQLTVLKPQPQHTFYRATHICYHMPTPVAGMLTQFSLGLFKAKQFPQLFKSAKLPRRESHNLNGHAANGVLKGNDQTRTITLCAALDPFSCGLEVSVPAQCIWNQIRYCSEYSWKEKGHTVSSTRDCP